MISINDFSVLQYLQPWIEGRVERNWIWVDNETDLPQVQRSDEPYYYIKDHLGTIRVTIDKEGTVVYAADYWPYGEKMAEYVSGGTTGQKYVFTEKERDIESGYDYFGSRYYDSDLGRWLSVDPLMDVSPGWTPYRYAFDNPLLHFDIDGQYESERLKAVEKAKEFAIKNIPYLQMDCSDLVATAIKVNEGYGDLRGKGIGMDGWQNGVAMIVGNSRKVELKEVREGDLLTFRTGREFHKGPDGIYDHIAIVIQVNKNAEGDISSVSFIHASSKRGAIVEDYLNDLTGRKLTGVWQWDTPDNLVGKTELPAIEIIGKNQSRNLDYFFLHPFVISNKRLFEMKKIEAGIPNN